MKISNNIFFIIAISVIFGVPALVRAASLTPGAYVEFGSICGKPILWRVISHDSNGFLLYSENAAGEKPYDAASDTVREDVYRSTHGSNYWGHSSLRDWLNSDAERTEFKNAVPDAAHVMDGKNSYDGESGFLYEFTSAEKKCINETENKSYLSYIDCDDISGGSEVISTGADAGDFGNTDKAFYRTVRDKAFILDRKTLYEKVIKSGYGGGTVCWTRTPQGDSSSNVMVCADDGTAYMKGLNAYNTNVNVCPALYINSSDIESGSGTAQKPYRLNVGGAYSSDAESGISCMLDVSDGNRAVYDIVNTSGTAVNIQPVVAVYCSSGLYYAGLGQEMIVDEKKRAFTRIDVPQNENYTVKLCLWNSLSEMRPYCPAAEKTVMGRQ